LGRADKPWDRIFTLCLIVLSAMRLGLEKEAMDRRSFVTSVLISVGILTITLGAANARPAVAPLDHVVPADDGNIETAWWRRRGWWRRRWHWRHPALR
jgi:hypothetical protein